MTIQAKVPPALAAAHNFVMDHERRDIDEDLEDNEDDLDPNQGSLLRMILEH
jgi:hypothetical protein